MKSVKRVACIVMVALLFCAVFAMSAMADGASINVEREVAVVNGETQVTVTVSIPAGTEIGGASVRLNYDSTKLTVVSSAVGAFPSTNVNTNIAGQVRGNFFTSEGISTGGVLYTVTFKVAAGKTVGAADISVYRYSLSDANGDNLSDVTTNSTFTCPHSWDNGVETKAPSCYEAGVKTYTCTLCGGTKTESTTYANHTWDDGVVTTDSTCTTAGVKTFTCQVSECRVTKTEPVAIDADAHSWNNGVVTTAPTCTTEGVKTYTCQHDGNHTYTEPVPVDSSAHKWNSGVVTTDPTCTTEGVKTYTCQHNGNHTYTEPVPVDSSAHKWNSSVVTTKPTCTTEGVKTYTCQHNGNHTYTEPVSALGHSYADTATFTWTEDVANATWTATYSVECEAGNCNHVATGDAVIDVSSSTAANCQEIGTTTYTASVTLDGKTYTEDKVINGAAGPHDWDEGTITTDSTCTEKGVRTYTCELNASHTKTENVAETGHCYDSETVAGKDENGHWFRCDNGCNVPSESKTHVEETPATCSSGALCEICGGEFGTVVADAHKWDAGTVTLEPDCKTGTPGTMHYVCELNNSHTKDEDIVAEHSWDEGEVTLEPTTTKEGERTYHCTVEGCEGTKTEPIAKLTPNGGSGGSGAAGGDIVKTGDEARPMLWLFILVAGIGAMALVVSKKKFNH